MTLPIRRAGWLVLALAACLAILVGSPTPARADGDPGSDVLLGQNLFAGADAGISFAKQEQLGKLLSETASVGVPVRVAIIAKQDDLGTLTPLWTRPPEDYAQYLGVELSLAYSGRLLVVMPTGYGVLDYGKTKDAIPTGLMAAVSKLPAPGSTASGLVSGATSAVKAIEAAAGVSNTQLTSAHAFGSASGSGTVAAPAKAAKTDRHTTPGVIFLIVAALFLVAYVSWRRGWRPSVSPDWWRRSLRGLRRVRIKPVALLPTVLLLIVVGALAINHADGGSTPVSDLANNPHIDPGTTLRASNAPGFTLTDESGKQVSLSQYRGKVVILSFVDAECQTICPLTTQAMLYAKQSLGAAGKDVQLLGVDANWKSTQVDDVLNYTELHGMTGHWHFLTGSLKQLNSVWSAYKVNEKKLIDSESNQIDHIAATFVISPQGQIRTVYTTYPSYDSVKQFGQVMAQDASKLLPSHPKVGTHYSYSEVPGITPSQSTTIPKVGGGSVKLGPGHAHLYLFFATWDTQTTPIAGEMAQLNAYAKYAKTHGLPHLTAIDEGSVEPSKAALPDFLRTIPGRLSYPVGIDQTGQVGDGYEVEGDPWFVLTTSDGRIAWYQEVYTDGWPTLSELEGEVKAGLSKAPKVPKGLEAQLKLLHSSPAPLAALHKQAAKLVPGDTAGLERRVAALRGYPVVINIWGSYCVPCQKEFGLFAQASALYGKKVAFLGADNDDEAADARVFLSKHPVTYPSYQTTSDSLDALLQGGLEGTPTTVYLSPAGKVLYVHIGQYESQGTLDADIQDYALGNAG